MKRMIPKRHPEYSKGYAKGYQAAMKRRPSEQSLRLPPPLPIKAAEAEAMKILHRIIEGPDDDLDSAMEDGKALLSRGIQEDDQPPAQEGATTQENGGAE